MASKPTILALGVFDGVHRGHQAVIGQACAEARRTGARAVVVTFDPHPDRILAPASCPRLLTAREHKCDLLHSLGVEEIFVVPFDAALAAMLPADFLDYLRKKFPDIEQIVVGEGWRFGRNGAGSAALICEAGIPACEIPILLDGDAPISSTRIREAVAAGHLDNAARWLGRPFDIRGEVIRGEQIGRTLGFPTANLAAHSEQFPPNGVYAGTAQIADSPALAYSCVIAIGTRPTISADNYRTFETHLLDFSGDLYGQYLTVAFHSHLRNEIRFPSREALRRQIADDVAFAREKLKTQQFSSSPLHRGAKK